MVSFPLASPSPATPKTTLMGLIYVALGLLFAAYGLMYSYSHLYLSVSTYSLACATQLAFNAFFSRIINSEAFTPFTLNSVVLLTFSSALLGLHSEAFTGFTLTITASALYSLILSLMELTLFLVSSLFSNLISTQGIPLAPVLAVILYHDNMNEIKAVASLLAMWGFASYFYKHYVEYKLEKRAEMAVEQEQASSDS